VFSWLHLITWTFSGTQARLRWPRRHFRRVISELHQRCDKHCGCGAFMVGEEYQHDHTVTDAIYFDDLDPKIDDRGAMLITSDGLSRLFAICRQTDRMLLGDIRAPRRDVTRVRPEQENPPISQYGYIRMFVTLHAPPIDPRLVAVFRYRGSQRWSGRSSCN